ncbi:hypothetical protein [Paenibacillus thermotolerans]|uniref:hypothetical protein n=1 Tax=Paenibacillus thermotolerans TaxID=3027807 RepID=UPI0023682770|nr:MULTISPECIES: hypothetical protein [unclassified Paenibacillus]
MGFFVSSWEEKWKKSGRKVEEKVPASQFMGAILRRENSAFCPSLLGSNSHTLSISDLAFMKIIMKIKVAIQVGNE